MNSCIKRKWKWSWLEVILIDSPQMTVSALSGSCAYARKHNMKMANLPENGLLSAGILYARMTDLDFISGGPADSVPVWLTV